MKGKNLCFFIGNVGKQPEIKHLDNGTTIASFSLAVNQDYKDKQGNEVKQVEWINLVAFGKIAEIIEKFVKKGDPLHIESKVKTRKWEDKEGNTRYTTEFIINDIIMLGGKQSDSNNSQKDMLENVEVNENFTSSNDNSDDLPF